MWTVEAKDVNDQWQKVWEGKSGLRALWTFLKLRDVDDLRMKRQER